MWLRGYKMRAHPSIDIAQEGGPVLASFCGKEARRKESASLLCRISHLVYPAMKPESTSKLHSHIQFSDNEIFKCSTTVICSVPGRERVLPPPGLSLTPSLHPIPQSPDQTFCYPTAVPVLIYVHTHTLPPPKSETPLLFLTDYPTPTHPPPGPLTL